MKIEINFPQDELKKIINNSVANAVKEIVKPQPSGQENLLMTTKEVCAFFDISLSTLHEWRKKGKLQAYYKGRRVYFKRIEVEASLVQAKN